MILEDFKKIWWASHTTVCGKCYSCRNIYRENLQLNVYLTTYGLSSRGWSSSQSKLMKISSMFIFLVLENWWLGFWLIPLCKNLLIEVHWSSWVSSPIHKRNIKQQLLPQVTTLCKNMDVLINTRYLPPPWKPCWGT